MQQIQGYSEQFIEIVRDSLISDEEKDVLVRFLNRFPEVPFYRFDEPDDTYPTWLQIYDAIFSGFFPEQLQWVLFSEEAQVFPNTTLFTDDEYWYNLGLSKTLSSEHEEIFFKGIPLLIIATYPKTLDSILAVKFDIQPIDKQVYEFNLEGVVKNSNGQWEVSADAMHVAFNSYVEMFDDIIALRGGSNPPIYMQSE